MRLGLIGAPGVGKSKFARQLATRLGKSRAKFQVIDNYVPKLKRRTGQAYDMWGNYLDNVSLAVERHNVELRIFQEYENTITVGTILDTITYASVFGERMRALDVAAYQEYYTRISTSMSFLGMMYTDLWTYDIGLLLLGEPAEGYEELQKYSVVTIEQLWAPVAIVPDNSERLDYVETLIERYVEDKQPETSEIEQRGVREGGTDGEAVGDSAPSLSDLLGPTDSSS